LVSRVSSDPQHSLRKAQSVFAARGKLLRTFLPFHSLPLEWFSLARKGAFSLFSLLRLIRPPPRNNAPPAATNAASLCLPFTRADAPFCDLMLLGGGPLLSPPLFFRRQNSFDRPVCGATLPPQRFFTPEEAVFFRRLPVLIPSQRRHRFLFSGRPPRPLFPLYIFFHHEVGSPVWRGDPSASHAVVSLREAVRSSICRDSSPIGSAFRASFSLQTGTACGSLVLRSEVLL